MPKANSTTMCDSHRKTHCNTNKSISHIIKGADTKNVQWIEFRYEVRTSKHCFPYNI